MHCTLSAMPVSSAGVARITQLRCNISRLRRRQQDDIDQASGMTRSTQRSEACPNPRKAFSCEFLEFTRIGSLVRACQASSLLKDDSHRCSSDSAVAVRRSLRSPFGESWSRAAAVHFQRDAPLAVCVKRVLRQAPLFPIQPIHVAFSVGSPSHYRFKPHKRLSRHSPLGALPNAGPLSAPRDSFARPRFLRVAVKTHKESRSRPAEGRIISEARRISA